MKTAKWLVVVGAMFLLFAAAAQAKPNFSGDWKMVPSKSDFGQMPAPSSIVQKISHNEPELKVTSTQVSENGESTNNLTYTTDGKECANKSRRGETKSTLKWDGDTLVIESKADFQGTAVTIAAKWTLSEDGKTLTVNTHFSSPMGDGDVKTVFEKQ